MTPARVSKATASGGKAAPHVALLRGINVGGKNKLPMKELAAIFAEAGAEAVTTYIQSGNVVFHAAPAAVAKLALAVTAAIGRDFGYTIPVVIRSARELAVLARENPFLRAGIDADKLHLMFLADAPRAAQIASLDPKRSPGDEWVVRGRDVYLHLPNGVGKSKLTNAYVDSKLTTVSTSRNWRTVVRLVEMAGE